VESLEVTAIVTSLADDHCLRGKRHDLEVSPCFDVAIKLNDPSMRFSIATGRFLKLDRSIASREQNYHFLTVINLHALVLEIIVVCARNVLISMLMAQFDANNNLFL